MTSYHCLYVDPRATLEAGPATEVGGRMAAMLALFGKLPGHQQVLSAGNKARVNSAADRVPVHSDPAVATGIADRHPNNWIPSVSRYRQCVYA